LSTRVKFLELGLVLNGSRSDNLIRHGRRKEEGSRQNLAIDIMIRYPVYQNKSLRTCLTVLRTCYKGYKFILKNGTDIENN
jgi:hypothetical protein